MWVQIPPPALAKIILHLENGELEHTYFAEGDKDVQTAHGFVPKSELEKPDGSVVKSNSGKEFIVFEAGFADRFQRFKRGPQSVIHKDIGMIIATTGLGPESEVLDAGAGSGWLALGMARVCKRVTTYEKREEFLATIKSNIALSKLTNITLKHADIGEGVEGKDYDLVTLDMPEPAVVLDKVTPALKLGGWIVCYLPTIPQVMETIEALKNKGYIIIKSIELMERPWHVDGRKVRPSSNAIGHTAFLVFGRRIR